MYIFVDCFGCGIGGRALLCFATLVIFDLVFEVHSVAPAASESVTGLRRHHACGMNDDDESGMRTTLG